MIAIKRVGFSMIEVVIATMLVGVLLSAALDSVGGSVRTWAAATSHLDGETLAQELLNEVIATAYLDPDSLSPVFGIESDDAPSGGSRLAHDDLDDYNGWTSSPPQLRDGTVLSQYAGWTRSVIVEKLAADDPTTALSAMATDEGVRRVRVTTTDPQGGATTLLTVRSQQGAAEQPPGLDMTIVSGVMINLEAGENSGNPWTLQESVNVINHATDQ